jgi:hypothetical protein
MANVQGGNLHHPDLIKYQQMIYIVYSLGFFGFFFVIAQWTLPNIILIRDIDMFSTYIQRSSRAGA